MSSTVEDAAATLAKLRDDIRTRGLERAMADQFRLLGVEDPAPRESDAGGRPWEPYAPLDHARDLPPMPLDVLPPWLRAMATEIARAYQVPPELPGMHSLALVSGAIAGKFVVRVRPGWVMPPVIYSAVAMNISEKKSPAVQALAEPFESYQRELATLIAADREEKITRAKQLRAVEAGLLKRLAAPRKNDVLADLQNKHTQAAKDAAAAEALVPPEARIISEFATPEALAERMANNHGRQILISDEGAGVLDMTSRYSKNGAADVKLLVKGYDGTSYTPDAVTRRLRPLTAATLTLAVAMQPTALADSVRANAEIRSQGLHARLTVFLPAQRAGSRTIRPAPVSPATLKIYQERMRALLDLPDQIDDDGRLVPRELVFSKEADDVMAAFEEEIEPDLAPGGRYERIGGAIGKLAGKAGRFAADLHVANYAGRSIPAEIPKETAAHAVRIARSTIPHTEALEDMLAAPPELLDARRIAAWLRRNGEPVVKDREILRGVRSIDQKARDTALRVLERHGLIRRPDGEPSRLGRPSPEWEVHPGWLTAEDDDALTLDDGDQAEAGA